MKPAVARGAPAVVLSLAVASACELRQITIADADDVVIAEFVLVAGTNRQTGVLHRTVGTDSSRLPVTGARVTVIDESGAALVYEAAPPAVCFIGDPAEEGPTCYQSVRGPPPPISFVTAGRRYTLRVELPDGRVLTGATVVPDAFQLRRPASTVCMLEPGTTLEVTWTRSLSAWVYAAETELRGLRDALARQGIELDSDPLRLFGLSVSNADTTIAFPAEFGLFDRFDPDLTEALAAIQGGLPPDVEAEVVIAAADRNWVNWERGGNFNPSGFVRVPSVFGDGTGVFGSLLPRSFVLTTGNIPGLPPC